eukprot:3374865-Rhodomonas_salina.1
MQSAEAGQRESDTDRRRATHRSLSMSIPLMNGTTDWHVSVQACESPFSVSKCTHFIRDESRISAVSSSSDADEPTHASYRL